ncbi:MAG: GNAT family N-acetyltransferase, partial [Planctomycetota bacterium]
MQKIELKEFENRIELRQLTLDDFDDLVDLQARCFPGMTTWSREQIESQVSLFPEGQLCITYEGKIVASSSSLILDFDLYSDWHDWRAVSDGGYIRNHDNDGDTMYGIEIMVDPEYRGMRLSRRLYDARKEIARSHNLQRIVIGGRIPGYHRQADQLTADEYVEKVMQKALYDPVLTAQVANGFQLRRLIPNYLPSDKESRGYATFLEWVNLAYQADESRRLHAVQMVRICVVQYQMRAIDDFEDFEKQCQYFVDVAGDYNSDFVVFPELFTTQLLSFIESKRPSEAARRLAEYTPQYLELFTELAVKYNVNIIGGSQFLLENDILYNVSYLFRRNGTLERQYKLHTTPSERKWWGVHPGDRMKVFTTDRGKIAIQICYDIEFPELSRIAARKGAQILFVPFNTDERYAYLRVRHCAQARAIENHCYVVMSGCVGNLPFADNADIHYAQSGIFTPADIPFSRDAVAAE